MSGASALGFREIHPLTTKPTGRFSTAGPLAARLQTCETGTNMKPSLSQDTAPPGSRLRRARATAYRGAKAGAAIGAVVFLVGILCITAHTSWVLWQARRPVLTPLILTTVQGIGTILGGTLVSAAWGGLIGALVMGIVGAVRRAPRIDNTAP
jgi:hypothetical protein